MFVKATASLPPLGITGAQMSVRIASADGAPLQTVTFNFTSSLSPITYVTLTGVEVTVDTAQRSVVGAWNPSRLQRAEPAMGPSQTARLGPLDTVRLVRICSPGDRPIPSLAGGRPAGCSRPARQVVSGSGTIVDVPVTATFSASKGNATAKELTLSATVRAVDGPRPRGRKRRTRGC
jgi:hypothetical protein